MRFEKVTYQELFPTGMYANQRIEASVLLDKNDDPMQGLREAKKLVREFFETENKEWLAQRGSEVIDLKNESLVFPKIPMTAEVKGWYEKALAEGDTDTIFKLEQEFIVEENKIKSTIDKLTRNGR